MRIEPVLLGLALSLGNAAGAQVTEPAPRWLSDSVSRGVTSTPPRPRSAPGHVAVNALPAPVTVAPLAEIDLNLLGLFPPERAGLNRGLWGMSDPATLARLIPRDRMGALPAARELLSDILLAELDPPRGAAADKSLFLSRVDTLLAMGDLTSAAALLERADHTDPALFRRWFDISILTGTENTACKRMRNLPEITPTYSARIFCLARGGDWDTAALTLDSTEALDLLSDQQMSLLVRFLELDDGEGASELPPPRNPDPLAFSMYEAIGEPIDTTALPLAFAHSDLRPVTGWKTRIEAAERLSRAGAIPPEKLWQVYHERKPAASGGLWERVAAAQRFTEALDSGDRDRIAATLPPVWQAMRAAGLEIAFARRHGAALARLDLDGDAARIAIYAGLLSDARLRLAGRANPSRADERFLVALARGMPQVADAPDELSRAIQDGFTAETLPDRLELLLAEDRAGEALLRGLTLLEDGEAGNLDALSAALALLLRMGLKDRAIEAGLQLLILERRG